MALPEISMEYLEGCNPAFRDSDMIHEPNSDLSDDNEDLFIDSVRLF